jgi:DNA-binding transcriptional LysR family regulator
MEMHQVRYFLATVSELNFTKAAEKCNVPQPSLTRAIKQLEDELGGDLFRRERPQAQLTELGQRMYPLLKQCYESAVGARSLAAAIKSGEVGALKLALSRTINLELLTSHLTELTRVFNRLELKLPRGTAPQVVEFLKTGEAELAIAGDVGEGWERLDRWPLFTEEFGLFFNARHRLAARPTIEVADLRQSAGCGAPIASSWNRRRHSFATTSSMWIKATSSVPSATSSPCSKPTSASLSSRALCRVPRL